MTRISYHASHEQFSPGERWPPKSERNVNRSQERFIDVFAERVLPQFSADQERTP